MTNNFRTLLLSGAAVACVLAGGGAFAADVTYERLLHPEPENWLSNSRTYDSNRFSPLEEITKNNVAGLKVAFTVPLQPGTVGAGAFASSLQGTPLVDGGIMFMSDGWGRVYRIDQPRATEAISTGRSIPIPTANWPAAFLTIAASRCWAIQSIR